MLSRSPHATAVSLNDDGTIVLHLRTQEYYRLNDTAQQLWTAFEEQDTWTVDELAQRLHRTASPPKANGPSHTDIEEDVEAFVETMIDHDLLTRGS
jgi:hypothetical protein